MGYLFNDTPALDDRFISSFTQQMSVFLQTLTHNPVGFTVGKIFVVTPESVFTVSKKESHSVIGGKNFYQ